MKSRLFKISTVVILAAMLFSAFGGQTVKADQSRTQPKHTLQVSETGLYIVRLQDASLAAYKGGISGLNATSPEATGARRLDTSSADSQVYLNYLEGQQSELLGRMTKAFGHPIEVAHQYQNVLNAVAVRISHEEALQAFSLPGVLTVYPDRLRYVQTDEGPELIGAPAIWNGETPDGGSTFGEGIIIGVLDTGINHAHPSFADIGGDGYDHTNPFGSGNYVGVCATDPDYADFCNDKLIGAYDLTDTNGPEDEHEVGHGSHTASTAGGNFVEVEFDDGAGGTFTVEISGVARHANLIAYRVCTDTGCPDTASVAAVDHAIEDKVDVINFSIGPSSVADPWADPSELAFLDASVAGVFVSSSAGNEGPDPSTLGHSTPWTAVVGGTTHGRILAHPVDVVTDTESRLGMGAVEGNGLILTADFTDSILWGGDVDDTNILGCDAWPAGAFDGVIGLVSRGDCTFEDKINNLADAGAVAALLYNNVGGPPASMDVASANTIPAMMISLEDGLAVIAMISGDGSAQATLHVAQNFVVNEEWEDYMYSLSSRGPSPWELVMPTYAAPAVNILAATKALEDDPVQYAFLSGTSMASPHSAGSAALLIKLHPDWTAAQIRSAIATTAHREVIDNNGLLADTFDIGSGRIDLTRAVYAGFVMDESNDNYIASSPYLGGEPSTLNQPSMVEYTCFGTCSWTRTIKSTLDVDQDWTITYEAAGITLSATPETFTLPAGGTQEIVITADVIGAVADTYYFGQVILTPDDNTEIAVAHLPVVVQLGVSNLPDKLNIRATRQAGTITLTDLQAYYDITDLWVEISGMALGEATDFELNQDLTNDDVYDDLTQVYWTIIDVPRDTMRLVVEIAASEASDIDLYVGTGDTPSEDTEICVSASGIWAEYCSLDAPARGTYWVLVENWWGTEDQPDYIRLITALVMAEDAGNLTITGLDAVPSMELFDLDVNWDEPTMEFGDFWYAQFTVFTTSRNGINLGYVNVDLEVIEPTIMVLPLLFKN